ncbi:MAG: aminotransferase class V-fold PLP-dependent enzyme [Actinomycetota bacterium]
MSASLLTSAEVSALRAATPFDPQRIHLNHAGASPSSSTVLAAQIDHLRLEATIGGYEAAAAAAEAEAATYDRLASLLGCRPGEIARQEHATAAWNAAFWSVPMQPGQRILTAEVAYGANAVGFLHAEATRGVRVEVIPSDEHGRVDVAALGDRLDDDVALVAITHVPTNGGLVNPAAEVGAITRAAGVPYLLDACQSVGQLALDVERLGCDLLSGTGRKYLRGPRGSGFLYASDRLIDRLVPATPDHHGADWHQARAFAFEPGARRFEHWEYNHAAWIGLGVAVDEALVIGPDRIEATIRERADGLRAALTAAGLPVFDLGTDRCGIVTTNVPGRPAADMKDELAAAGINVSVSIAASTRWDFERRHLDPMLRLSVHVTTTESEIERAVAVLAGVA